VVSFGFETALLWVQRLSNGFKLGLPWLYLGLFGFVFYRKNHHFTSVKSGAFCISNLASFRNFMLWQVVIRCYWLLFTVFSAGAPGTAPAKWNIQPSKHHTPAKTSSSSQQGEWPYASIPRAFFAAFHRLHSAFSLSCPHPVTTTWTKAVQPKKFFRTRLRVQSALPSIPPPSFLRY
jgi:hypothetical protein